MNLSAPYGMFFVAAAILASGTIMALLVHWRAKAREANLAAALQHHNDTLGRQQADLDAARLEVQRLQELHTLDQSKIGELQTRLEIERRNFAEKIGVLKEAEEKLTHAFKALSADALEKNNASFLHLAKATLEKHSEGAQADLEKRQQSIDQMVKPIRESLDKVDQKIQDLEKSRHGAYEGLRSQVQSLLQSQVLLHHETTQLVQALRTPAVRGRWGEIQLKRVVEMAGMLNHCDFVEQESISTPDGRLRPDLIVHLPGGRSIFVDSKVPLEAFLDAQAAEVESVRRAKIQEHARRIRAHITQLSRKNYWEQFEHETPELVVLFLPGENFFSAALQEDPSLIENGAEQKIILATPTTLIALLRAVAYGWRHESLEKNAQRICDLGRELYERVAKVGEHIDRLGKSLGNAVEAYNQTVGTLESRVLVSARKFKELAAADGKETIEEIAPLDHHPRTLTASEFVHVEEEP